MVLIDRKFNAYQDKYENTYLANDAADVAVSEVDENSATGSVIMVVGSGAVYIKNTEGKWQKSGSTEVLA